MRERKREGEREIGTVSKKEKKIFSKNSREIDREREIERWRRKMVRVKARDRERIEKERVGERKQIERKVKC